MKRLLAALLLSMTILAVGAQTTYTVEHLRAKGSITLAGTNVTGISRDTTGGSKSTSKLISEEAAKKYADAVGGKRPKVFDLVKDGGAANDGSADVAQIINTAFANGYLNIDIPGGDFKFTKRVKLVDGCSIVGIGGEGTRLVTTMDSAFFVASRSSGGNNSTITGVCFVGDYTGGILGTSTKTKQDGVFLDSATLVLVTNVRAKNLGGYMFHSKKNSWLLAAYVYWATRANIVTDNIVTDSYGAVHLDSLAEYCVVSNNIASNNVFSIRHSMAANNIITGNDFGGNRFGFYSTGGLGNIGHAPVTNNSFNHCNVPLYITDAPTGWNFSNNEFYTDRDSIYIYNSSYLRFYGGFFTANHTYDPAKIKIDNCTNCSFSDVDEVFGYNSTWEITGEVPTFFINGKNSTKAFTISDKKYGRDFSIKNDNGIVSMFGMDSLQVKGLRLSSSATDSMVVQNGVTGTLGKRAIPSGGGGSSSTVTYTTITGNYTALSTDHYIFVNNGSSAITITLPAASSVPGKQYIVQRTDNSSTGAVQLTPTSGNITAFDGSTWTYANLTYWYDTTRGGCAIVSNGTKWLFVQ